MGQIHSAMCEACGYNQTFQIGGSRHNFDTNSPFPILCRTCKKITSINRAEKEPRPCLSCGGFDYLVYGMETMECLEVKRPGDEDDVDLRTKEWLKNLVNVMPDDEAAEFISTILWDKVHHLCPKCGKHSLKMMPATVLFD